jgi:hypothetical protein
MTQSRRRTDKQAAAATATAGVPVQMPIISDQNRTEEASGNGRNLRQTAKPMVPRRRISSPKYPKVIRNLLVWIATGTAVLVALDHFFDVGHKLVKSVYDDIGPVFLSLHPKPTECSTITMTWEEYKRCMQLKQR